MREQSSSRWQRRGSSVVFDQRTLSPLLTDGCLIPLRTFLGWRERWPDAPKGNGNTVLVGGLEACLELFSPAEVEDFLRFKVRPVVERFQSTWDQRGLVFGFSKPANAFQIETTTEEIRYVRQDRQIVRLTHSLWNGGAAMDLTQLLREGDNERSVIGYYVPRLS